MTFVTARELRLKPAEVWEKLAKEGDIVVTVNGRPSAIITGITPESMEGSLLLLKRVRAEAALGTLRNKAAKNETGNLSLAAINKEINASRKARK